MENMAAKVTAAFFDQKQLRYDRRGENGEAIIAGFAMDNKEGMKVLMVFDDNNSGVKLTGLEIAKFPESKKADVYKLCSEMNARFRWAKFYVDEDDNTIVAEDDAVIFLDTCGEEVLRCCLQLVKVVDVAYPMIMKALYA